MVARITEEEGGPVTAYSADLRITCSRCGESFVFVGLDRGLAPDRPMMSFLGDEARLPIRPRSEAPVTLPFGHKTAPSRLSRLDVN